MTTKTKKVTLYVLLFSIWLISGCAKQPPTNVNNICSIFIENKIWYSSADDAERKWNVPAAQILAFIYQESSFKSWARPPRKKLFGFIPWRRPSSAFGYAQATVPTWKDYKKDTGKTIAFRNNFRHAADFIGWYNHKSINELKLNRNDTYKLYLAYHEGRGGYRAGTYKKKAWLRKVADKVKRRADNYNKQLKTCRGSLKKPLFGIF